MRLYAQMSVAIKNERQRWMDIQITKTFSIPARSFIIYVSPLTVALVASGLFLSERGIKLAIPIICVINGIWWAYLWHHKVGNKK